MLPILVFGGAALAALFLEGCRSDSSNTNHNPTPPSDASASPSNSASTAPSASASSVPPADSTSVADAGTPPDDASDSPTFSACEVTKGEEWKSNFNPGMFVGETKFQELIKGGSFCLQASLTISSGTCKDASKTYPLVMDSASLDRRMIRFNLESVVGTGANCPSLFSIKAIDCHPTLNVSDILPCTEKSLLLNPLLIGNKVSLVNLLKGDGNGDAQKDLLVQLSNGTGILLTQAPPPCPPEGCGE